ncbi:MAG: penicillin-binding protein activator [Halieaceae bacterium]|nr:penicillin-binding protein activator [Halieaceae bacterium]
MNRTNSTFSLRPLSILAALALLSLLASCASGPVEQTRRPLPADDIVTLPPESGEETAYTARLREAEQLLAERQLLPAASILRDLDADKLSASERVRSLAMETELLYLQGDTATALAGLRETVALLGPLDPALRDPLDRWQLRLVLTEEGPLAAARLADRLLLTNEDPARETALLEFIWHNLQRTPVDTLDAQLQQPVSQHWRGWLELAVLAADVMESPEVQLAQLDLWRERHASHRAALQLPGGLAALDSTQTPGRIALLLPLSGGARDNAQALLQGYLAAQFEARRRGWPEQELMVMDSAAQPDFNSAYQVAVRAGAELVIGPLTPEALLDWQPLPEDPVPVMTLAWHPAAERFAPRPATPFEGVEGVENLEELEAVEAIEAVEEGTPTLQPPVQLGLTAVDEARQLARLGYDSGARTALLIRPAGDWGDTMSDALGQAWREREGELRAIATFTGQTDYSSSLKAALSLSESESRATRMRRLLGEPTEFTPRRRQDIDIVFLLSDNPQHARSIKPLIAFHYAGDLPVYSTSAIFSGRRDPQRDRDLNGIRLLEMPWMLATEGGLSDSLGTENGEDERAGLHALGADAFMLTWRLAQLRDSGDARVRGNTGLLNMDNVGRVHRELVPAQFQGGVPQTR